MRGLQSKTSSGAGWRKLAALACVIGLVSASCGSDSASESDSSPPATSADSDADNADDTAPSETVASTSVGSETEGDGAATDEPFKIAVVIDATGPNSALQLPGLAGFRTAVDELNSSGGIDGHPVELEVIDTTSTAEGAQAAARRAIESEASLIYVAVLTTEFTANIALFANSGKQVFAPAGVIIMGEGTDPTPWLTSYGWLLSYHHTQYLEGLRKALGDLDGKRIAIQKFNSAIGDLNLPLLIADLEAEGAEVTVVEEFAPTQTSFDGQAANIVASEPDGIALLSGGPDVPIVTNALTTAGWEGPMVSNLAAGASTLAQLQLENLYAGYPYLVPGEDVEAAAEAAGESTDGGYFPFGYLQAHIIFEGLQACGFPCTDGGFGSAIDSLGEIDIPLAPGSLIYSPDFQRSGFPGAQYYVWDEASGSVVALDEPVPLGDRPE